MIYRNKGRKRIYGVNKIKTQDNISCLAKYCQNQ